MMLHVVASHHRERARPTPHVTRRVPRPRGRARARVPRPPPPIKPVRAYVLREVERVVHIHTTTLHALGALLYWCSTYCKTCEI